jgi:hypothetical protein
MDEERKQEVNYLSTLNGKLIGWVMNKLNNNKGRLAKTKKIQTIKKAEV